MTLFKASPPNPSATLTVHADLATAAGAPVLTPARTHTPADMPTDTVADTLPGQRTRLGVKPARFTLGLPALLSSTSSGGPARPDVDGGRRRGPQASAQAMSAARNDAAVQRSRAGMAELHPVSRPAPGLPTTPDTVMGVQTEAGFRRALQGMFGVAAAHPELGNLVLGAVAPATEGDAPYAAPLMLATAMRSVGVDSVPGAKALLIASTQGKHLLRTLETDAQGQARRNIVPMNRVEHFLPEHDRLLFRLERVLASTTPGTQALGQLRHLQGQPHELQAVRDSLQLCSALQAQGVALHDHASPQDVLQHLAAQPATKIDAAIGHDDDAPLQLLAKALRHAHHGGTADATRPDDKAAFAAWKQGGFVQSGKGTDFNHTIERLHKFLTYVDRADHGPRTAGNLASDARAWLGRMVGVGKSPLTQMRHGAQGADRGLLQHEVAKYQAALDQALSAAVDNLVDELHDPALRSQPARRDKHLAQAAVLDLWRQTGQAKIPLADVQRRASELLAQVDPQAAALPAAALQPHLRRFTRATRDDAGAPALKVSMQTLEAAGAARQRGAAGQPGTTGATGAGAAADPQAWREEIQRLRALPGNSPATRQALANLQGKRRQLVTALLDDMRSIQEARVESKPLFKFSDLKALLRGTPRSGPTAADAQAVMNTIAHAPYESSSSFANGASRGLGSFGALLLGSGATLGLPLAYPILQAEFGRRARVSLGVTNTGARLYVGTETSRSASVGVGAGWAAPPLAGNKMSAVALAEASLQRSTGQGAGAVITARNDKPGWQDTLPKVVDFLFEQAQLPKGDGRAASAHGGGGAQPPVGSAHRAQDAGELWQRFSERFGDDATVAVGWSNEHTASTAAQVSAVAVARVAASPTTSIGPALSAGLRVQGSHFQRTPHAPGADVPVVVRNRAVSASASVTLTQTLPAAVPGTGTPAGGSVMGWGSAVPWAAAHVEVDVGGALGVARLGRTREGELAPGLCHREVLFQQPKTLVAYANLHRADWEAAMVAQDPAASTTPETARQRMNTFLEQMATLPATDAALHGELRTLAPAVAAQINLLEARLSTLGGRGDHAAQARPMPATERAECRAIEQEVHQLLQAATSWAPAGLYGVEFNHQSGTGGINLAVRAVHQEEATVARLTALLVASLPHV